MKEKNSQLEINLYLQDSEVNRAIKEKNLFKEDLKSLRKDYMALSKVSKSQCISKSSVEWKAEITTLEKELHDGEKQLGSIGRSLLELTPSHQLTKRGIDS